MNAPAGVLDFDALRTISKRKHAGHVIRWLDKNGVRWLTDADGNPFTTVQQLDNAMQGEQSGGFEFGEETTARR